MKMRSRYYQLVKVMGITAISFAFVFTLSLVCGKNAFAAPYKQISHTLDLEEQYQGKIGDYHFKTTYGIGTDWKTRIYRSKKKNSGYRLVCIYTYDCFTNGKSVLRVTSNNKLQRVSCASKKATTLKRLKTSDRVFGWEIQAVVKKRVHLKRNREMFQYDSYLYNIKTKKLKKANANYMICAQRGTRLVVTNKITSEIDSVPLYLCRSTAKGFKVGKLIANMGQIEGGWFVGKKLYYAEYTDTDGTKLTLYKAKLDGTGRKKIKTFKSSGTFLMDNAMLISKCTSKDCLLHKPNGLYRYTYKTKKLKCIKKYE